MSVAWNAVKGLRDIYRSVSGHGKIVKRSNQTKGASDLHHPNTLLTETLEPRLLLSGAMDAETAIELFNTSPAVFIANQGQWEDDSVYFLHKGDGANVAHTGSGPVFELFREAAIAGPDLAADLSPDPIANDTTQAAMESFRFSLEFQGNNSVIPVGLDESDSLFNFCIGDQSNWREGLTGYETVAYEGLYDGIDLYTWGQRDSLKYEFHVSPGADYEQIVLSYSGVENLSLTEDGSLIVNLGGDWGVMTDDAPYIYQIIDGEEVAVEGRFVLLDGLDGLNGLDKNAYSFEITGDYDKNHELIIDPDVAWSTYLGGSGSDSGYDIAVDSSGNVLVTGKTSSSGWVSGGYDTSYNDGWDAFIVKLSSSGSHIWSTYLGGASTDFSCGIAVDSSGNALVTGRTSSSGWVSGGWDTSHNGDSDGFVVKLSFSGSHIWSTYLGGSGFDGGMDIAVDSSGNALVTGQTYSSGWVFGGWDTSYNDGNSDAFVVKLSSSGSHIWSTYLGGSGGEYGSGIVTVDSSGNVLVTGETSSSGWVFGGWDIIYNGSNDGFVVKLSSSGSHFWSTYLGGSDWETDFDIAVDSSGNALVTGKTNSSGWVSGGWDTSHNGSYDGFVVKLSFFGKHLWSTYLGGSGYDGGVGIAVDSSGNVLMTGRTQSSGWVSGGWDTSHNGGYDGFVVKLSASGGHLWSTYLGGSDSGGGRGIAVDSSGNAFVTGSTFSSGWVSGGWDDSYNGSCDAFVVKISCAVTVSTIEQQWVFYNNSSLDGNNAGANIDDDDAIDYGKQVLLLGETVSADNITSYSRGINGIMIDIADLPSSVSASDFIFKAGNLADPTSWGFALIPAYIITVRPGEGAGGSDRVTIIWADDTIKGQWLEVTVKATANTGLSADETFYFGNLPGDVNGDLTVNLDDFIALKQNYGSGPNATIAQADFDCNGTVNLDDFITLKQNYGQSLATLGNIPAAAAGSVDILGQDYTYTTAPISSSTRDTRSTRLDSTEETAIKPSAPELTLLGNLGSQEAAILASPLFSMQLPVPIDELV